MPIVWRLQDVKKQLWVPELPFTDQLQILELRVKDQHQVQEQQAKGQLQAPEVPVTVPLQALELPFKNQHQA